MLLKAIALFLIINSIILSTESQTFSTTGNRCYVIRDTQGHYLSVNSGRVDRQRKLVLETKFDGGRSSFRFQSTGQVTRLGHPIYRIVNCANNELVSWSNKLKLKDLNYYVYAREARQVLERNVWIITRTQGSQFLEIKDASFEYNLFSSSSAENGERLALVYGARWPINLPPKEANKRFWSIEFAPNVVGKSFKEGSDENGELSNVSAPFAGSDENGELSNVSAPFAGSDENGELSNVSAPFAGSDENGELSNVSAPFAGSDENGELSNVSAPFADSEEGESTGNFHEDSNEAREIQ